MNDWFNIFVSIIVSVYILSGRKELLKGIKRFAKATLKENTYNQISNYFYKSNAIFFKFISSQLIDAILVGLLSTIALSILKVKYAPLLGFTIGLFNDWYLLVAIVSGIILQVFVTAVPVFSKIFQVTNLNVNQWLIVGIISIMPIILTEIQKKINEISYGKTIYIKEVN